MTAPTWIRIDPDYDGWMDQIVGWDADRRDDQGRHFAPTDWPKYVAEVELNRLMAEKDAEIARLREALRWYADETAYDQQCEPLPCGCCSDLTVPIEEDRGAIARAALVARMTDDLSHAKGLLADRFDISDDIADAIRAMKE